MKIEDIIKKISAVAAGFIIYMVAAGFYLSAKGFSMLPDGNIVLMKEAHAADLDSAVANLAEPVNPSIAFTLPDGPYIGNENAPVTMYEFSSLNCSHCADFHLSTLPKLKKEFADKGNLKIIFTNFPLDRKSMKAAMLSACVPESGYNNFITTLFKNQREWILSRNTDKTLINYAVHNGLTEQQAKDCLKNDELAKEILDVRQQGLDRLKIQGTPAFLIVKGNNKEIIHGIPDYNIFSAYLQKRIYQ